MDNDNMTCMVHGTSTYVHTYMAPTNGGAWWFVVLWESTIIATQNYFRHKKICFSLIASIKRYDMYYTSINQDAASTWLASAPHNSALLPSP